MTKLLRILTGIHAGAEVRLDAGAHRIGTDDDADIRLSDWRGEDVVLSVDASGVTSARRAASAVMAAQHDEDDAASASEEPGTVILIDYVPMQFDDTVLCVGDVEGPWPSDLDLLSTLLVKPDEARRAADRSRRRRMTGIVSACAMLAAVIVIGSVLLTTAASRAALPHDARDLAQRVNLALGAAHLRELHAQAQGSSVIVTGMVGTPEEDTLVRNMLAKISPTGIVRRYDVALNDVRTIADSLATPGVSVRYAGHGNFAITGRAANPRDVTDAVARMRHDLGGNVKELRVSVAQLDDVLPASPSFSLVMASDDVRYAETPDGVKHIYAVPEAAAAASASPAVNAANAATPPGDAASAHPADSASATPDVVQSGAARGVMQPVANDTDTAGAAPAASQANTTAYAPLPK